MLLILHLLQILSIAGLKLTPFGSNNSEALHHFERTWLFIQLLLKCDFRFQLRGHHISSAESLDKVCDVLGALDLGIWIHLLQPEQMNIV